MKATYRWLLNPMPEKFSNINSMFLMMSPECEVVTKSHEFADQKLED